MVAMINTVQSADVSSIFLHVMAVTRMKVAIINIHPAEKLSRTT